MTDDSAAPRRPQPVDTRAMLLEHAEASLGFALSMLALQQLDRLRHQLGNRVEALDSNGFWRLMVNVHRSRLSDVQRRTVTDFVEGRLSELPEAISIKRVAFHAKLDDFMRGVPEFDINFAADLAHALGYRFTVSSLQVALHDEVVAELAAKPDRNPGHR